MEARTKEHETIDGQLFADMVRSGAVNLEANRQIVNDLNVFPIPDGDTGDNMYMTIDSGAAAVANENSDELSKVASAVAKGMLLGARGNSGVILSRIFSGIAHGLEGVGLADIGTFCRAFEMGVDEAYRAVAIPVEGTILTVYKDAVRYAKSKLNNSSTPRSYFIDFMNELRRSLDRTPELLAVLKESGVVDSGGAGLIYIAEGMQKAVEGNTESAEKAFSDVSKKSRVDISSFTEDSTLEYGYCTEFLLRLQNSKTDVRNFNINELTDYLNSVGDSTVCFKDGSIVKAHVHTMKPGDILNHCQQYGEFLTLKIENMTLQHNEANIENRFTVAPSKPHKRYGIVTVAAGDGIKSMFKELGCDKVIEGGQSMNPSAQDFIKAFEDINADTILVYPNNGNVILTAEQAKALYKDAEIRIIPTKTIGEGYAAISMLDTSNQDADELVCEQKEIIENVLTGAVSRASRNTVKNGINIVKDDFISFVGDTVYSDTDSANASALALAEKIDAGSFDVILVICGKSVTNDERKALEQEFRNRFRNTETILIDGGQPVFDYIMVFE
ncbi:MAG: DAK2 domain-containing protein [Clostridia bacterium]|nr:DAK2 domain-containing protein [Clostridia bacterium]